MSNKLSFMDYGYFSEKYKLKDLDLAKSIWNLKTDEELHGLWLREKVKSIMTM